MNEKKLNITYDKKINEMHGLTLNDLNKYLPAIQKIDELKINNKALKEGIFYGLSSLGLKKIPSDCIDLIIAQPPVNPLLGLEKRNHIQSIQEYIEWNQSWINECFRTLKKEGSFYLMCNWKNSGMFQSLIGDKFNIVTRISWKDTELEKGTDNTLWTNKLSDIWFGSKSNNYFFNSNQKLTYDSKTKENFNFKMSNFWDDLIDNKLNNNDNQFSAVIKRIINASSSKLNWILDPFARTGKIGFHAVSMGRRFIGFEANIDKIIISMKRIDKK